MTATQVPVEEQMRTLMRGIEFGDPHIQATMEAELRTRLAEGRPLRVYCGFDPTAVDLTLGHMVPMFKMRQFQQLGHDVTFVIGTMTGMIGDPTDRSAARTMLTAEQVNANAETWQAQALRILDPQRTTFKRNSTWLAPMTLADMIQLASNFTVSQFLEKESFRKRLEEGRPVYIHEFMYAMMQAYDAHVLETDVQLGGVDQLFNIMAGRQLQKAMDERPLIALTTPLLLGTDGHLKMSKSVGNYIGIDDEPADKFGKIMSIPDSLIVNYYTLLTDTPTEEIEAIDRGLAERTLNPMETKKRLGHTIVALLDGPGAAARAQSVFEQRFQRREELAEPSREERMAAAIRRLFEAEGGKFAVRDLSESQKELVFPHDQLGYDAPPAWLRAPDGWRLPAILVDVGLTKSVSEGRSLVKQRGIRVNGQVIDRDYLTTREFNPGTLINVGPVRTLRLVSE